MIEISSCSNTYTHNTVESVRLLLTAQQRTQALRVKSLRNEN